LNFPGGWTGRGKQTVESFVSFIISLWGFLWGDVGNQMISQSVNMLDEMKVRIISAAANVTKKSVLVRGELQVQR
jgi:hypothetical protein